MTDIQPLGSVPLIRRLWVVVLLTCLILTFPIAMVILLTGDVYKKRQGTWQPIKASSRYVYGGLLLLWLIAATVKAIVQPGGIAGMWARSENTNDVAAANASASSNGSRNVGNASTPPTKAEVQAESPKEDNPPSQRHSLNVQVATEQTQYGEAMILTAEDAFTLERIVFNGRAEEKNCDLPKYGISIESTDTSNEAASMQSAYGTQLPKELKVGDRAVFFLGCGALVKFDLYTDHGLWHFKQ